MKTQLIMLDTPIIVSDEEITKLESGTSYYDGEGNIRKWSTGNMYNIYSKKIIAGIEGLPKIDWNGLEDKFGWVDVEKLSIEKFGNSLHHARTRSAFIKGFKKAQSLKEKKFSLEDMRVAWLDGWQQDQNERQELKQTGFIEFIRQLQQPKVFDIEVEMKPIYLSILKEKVLGYRPKITDNSIKILRKL